MSIRTRVGGIIDSTLFQNTILAVILFNAIILGLETVDPVMARAGEVILLLDKICLAIFVVEIAAKLFARGIAGFFRSGWNIFDFVIVGISLVPGSQSMSVLRALRILRVLRVVSVAPRLRRVVEGFITALPGMGSVFLLMAMIFYVGAVMATKLFGATFPEFFGSLGNSAYTLFQIMTLESWSMGIVRPVMEAFPYSWAFFIPFIVATSFTVLNLFIGIIVSAMQEEHEATLAEERDTLADNQRKMLQEMRELRREVAALR